MPLPANSGGLNLRGTIVNHAAIPRYIAGRWRCVIGVNLSESGINLRQSNSGAAHIQQRIALQPRYSSTSGISATTNLEPRPRLRTCKWVIRRFPNRILSNRLSLIDRRKFDISSDNAQIYFVETLEINFDKF